MPADDRWLSAGALLASAVLAVNVIQSGAPPRIDAPLPEVPLAFDNRVNEIAEAIAVSEGYYAPGVHDGHSLPYRLNNPGALKKPALEAAALPTWKDTGLIVFPTTAMGWAALRHQVRLMLTGASDVYRPTDTLITVAGKYADGDERWGGNVAARLGIAPDATLAELAVSPPLLRNLRAPRGVNDSP
jgi:hypothetical protein